MPFYEYQCNHCGHSLEAMQKVSDAPLKKCPECGKSQLRKLMSAPVFRLKGAGWYETDFKSDGDNKRNLADRPEADASKDDKKATTEAASKDAATDAAKPKDKTADKPAEKSSDGGSAPATPVKKAAEGAKSSKRRSAAAPAKRPARHPVKRAAAKPARRR